MTKNELQGIAAHRLAKSRRLICQWATGCGKSGVLLRFIKDNPGMSCLILVPEQNNIQNWKNEFAKFGVPDENVVIACYASFKKFVNTVWDILVFDEMPHVDTEKRLAVCRAVRGEYVLALGAVIDREERDSLESVYGKFEKSVISLETAMSYGILPAPRVLVLHMSIDDSVRKYKVDGRICTAKGKYEHLQSLVEKAKKAYNANPTEFMRIRMLKAGNDRKRFLGTLKDNALSKLCSELEAKRRRFICFCASISQAEYIGGEKAFTSKTPRSLKVLDRFNSGGIDSIYVVGKLIEGENLNNIECGVIGQLGGKDRITVQSVGRVMRSDNPVIYVPVFDDTKDIGFLRTLTDNVPESCVKHYKY